MAKKCEFMGFQAYKEDCMIIANDPEAGWVVVHEPSKLHLMGPGVDFKQKKTALAYVNGLLSGGFDWDFKTEEECWENNDKDAMFRCRMDSYKAAKEIGK